MNAPSREGVPPLRAPEDVDEPMEQNYSVDRVLLRRRLEFAGPLTAAFKEPKNKYTEKESSGLHRENHRQHFGRIGLRASSLSAGSTGKVATDRQQRILIFSEPLPHGNLVCDIESPLEIIKEQKSDSAENPSAGLSGGNAFACEESKTKVESTTVRSVQSSTHDDSLHDQEVPLFFDYDETDTTCGICLMEYEVNDVVAWSFIEQCKHAYHEGCIASWLHSSLESSSRRRPTCPICRHEFIIGG